MIELMTSSWYCIIPFPLTWSISAECIVYVMQTEVVETICRFCIIVVCHRNKLTLWVRIRQLVQRTFTVTIGILCIGTVVLPNNIVMSRCITGDKVNPRFNNDMPS
jgi:hypothetical protein